MFNPPSLSDLSAQLVGAKMKQNADSETKQADALLVIAGALVAILAEMKSQQRRQ